MNKTNVVNFIVETISGYLYAVLQLLAMKTAEASESTIILANDPDADRLAVAEKNG